jgi:hypothetical protein
MAKGKGVLTVENNYCSALIFSFHSEILYLVEPELLRRSYIHTNLINFLKNLKIEMNLKKVIFTENYYLLRLEEISLHFLVLFSDAKTFQAARYQIVSCCQSFGIGAVPK